MQSTMQSTADSEALKKAAAAKVEKRAKSLSYVKNLARVGAKYAVLREGKEKQQDLLKALQFYTQAAQFGHPGANYELAVMHDRGVPGLVARDEGKATEHYFLAAAGGMPQAKFNLGLMYYEGRGVRKDCGRAMRLWEGAAALNHAKSMVTLAEKYFNGLTPVPGSNTSEVEGCVHQDFGKALHYWGLAAELDHPKAIYSLAIVHELGVGVEASEARARALYELSAYCWAQQNQPPPGREGHMDGTQRKPVKLPAWFKVGDVTGKGGAGGGGREAAAPPFPVTLPAFASHARLLASAPPLPPPPPPPPRKRWRRASTRSGRAERGPTRSGRPPSSSHGRGGSGPASLGSTADSSRAPSP